MGQVDPLQQGSAPAGPRRARRARAGVLAGLAAIALSACSEQIIKHGHHFRETDLQQVQTGMSQDQVKLTLGSPATTTTVGDGSVYYYISSTMKQTAFLDPKEVDRQILAVYFTPMGSVERVAQYGLKDGKVFDYISRTTPAPGARDEGILKQLFRNLGQKPIFGDG
jgi:outer membrane protein assembly factor BamE (lipoprotein component of BamABCDE complex)